MQKMQTHISLLVLVAVLKGLDVTTDCQFTDEGASQNGAKVADVHRHDS
jgi:hypothetical protein